MRKLALLFLFSFLAIQLKAQEYTGGIEMATGMRSSGKIYVVVATIAIIFVGLVWYLITLDKRISNIEKKVK